MHKSCKSQCLTYKYINHSFYTHTQTKCIIKWKNYYIVEIETIFLSENTTKTYFLLFINLPSFLTINHNQQPLYKLVSYIFFLKQTDFQKFWQKIYLTIFSVEKSFLKLMFLFFSKREFHSRNMYVCMLESVLRKKCVCFFLQAPYNDGCEALTEVQQVDFDFPAR